MRQQAAGLLILKFLRMVVQIRKAYHKQMTKIMQLHTFQVTLEINMEDLNLPGVRNVEVFG